MTVNDIVSGLYLEFYAKEKEKKTAKQWESLRKAAYIDFDITQPSTKVWTRGDGSKYKDPGTIKPWHKKNAKDVHNFYDFIKKHSGTKSMGKIGGEFGSSKPTDAVIYKNIYFTLKTYSNGEWIEFGSASRMKNTSVWALS